MLGDLIPRTESKNVLNFSIDALLVAFCKYNIILNALYFL